MSARLLDLVSMLKVGSIGFGGGSALIPVFDDELVRRRGVMDPVTSTRHAVVASITPGALPVKLGGLAGWHLSGAWLSLAMAVVVALPGTASTVGLLVAVAAGGQEAVRYVELASVGITVFIIALLLHYVASVVGAQGRGRRTAVAITVVVAVVTGAPALGTVLAALVGQRWEPQVPTLGAVQVIGVVLVVIVVRAAWRARRSPASAGAVAPVPVPSGGGAGLHRAVALHLAGGVAAAAVVAVLVGPAGLQVLGLIALSTVSSFGGGEAYVGVADGFFVQGGHVASSDFYNQLVPIANALPGPILVKLAAGVGYSAVAGAQGPVTGVLVAAAAAVVAVTTCTALALVVLGPYVRAAGSPLVHDIGRFVLPVICGLLLATSAAMLDAAADVARGAGAASPLTLWASLAGVVLVAKLRAGGRVHDVLLIAACGTVSEAALLLA